MAYSLDFEQPLSDLERQISELRRLSNGNGVDLTKEANRLDRKLQEMRKDIYNRLTPWQKTQIARHPERPYTLDYVRRMLDGYRELHGDRLFADDPAICAGFGLLDGRPVAVIGHQKGRDTRNRIMRNFGQAHPEGYRKALRVMRLAEKFGRPVVTLIDTPGAYPGVGAEERGQAEAIARNLFEMAQIRVPIVAIVIGEGGSGGALALGVGDRVFMMEHSVYSVISPEGCAAILWKKDKNELAPEDYARAATALKLTAEDLKRLGVIDDIIAEPTGGMHNAEDADFLRVKEQIKETLSVLDPLSADELCAKRVERLYAIGQV